jgi:hypothetical protein
VTDFAVTGANGVAPDGQGPVGGPLAVAPSALAKKLVSVLRNAPDKPAPVVLVRAAPDWPYDPVLALDGGREVQVSACVSPLAVWDRLAAHDGRVPLAILTDLDVQQLGFGILSRIWQRQIETVEPWDVISQEFGASGIEGELTEQSWAWVAEALLDARPPHGWTQLGGGMLGLDTALRQLAGVRLGLDRLAATPDDLDVPLLLRWTTVPGLPQALWSLREAERDGLVRWLRRQLGAAADAIFSLVAAGHAADALPLGLVCQAVWAGAGESALRAQGRIEHWFGGRVDDAAVGALATAAGDLLAELVDRSSDDDGPLADRVLIRAEDLLTQFGAGAAAASGDFLLSGFEARLGSLAQAIEDALRHGATTAGGLAAAEVATDQVQLHRLARREPSRVERARMALRLLRWLSIDTPVPASVADGIDRQIAEWAWVDRALSDLWLGDDQHPRLAAAYRRLYRYATGRRKQLDAAFAQRLAAWTSAGPAEGPEEPLLVERLLPTVLAPFGKRDAKPLLFIVLDGMSAAVAVELAEQLTREAWVEYDPIGPTNGGTARRRGVVAALPTITAVSRTSLFAAQLCHGDQSTEQRTFTAHRWWRAGGPMLFHKEPTSEPLIAAVTSDCPVVAVVINTVDDALGPGREAEESGWDVSRLGALRTLLRHARAAGRAVLLTSDHGHVLDRGGELRTPNEQAKARFREGIAPVVDGEVKLSGPRVVAGNNRIVALWDTDVRYRQRRAGYHGGASLAEVTIPLLAYVPMGAKPPAGWVAVDTQPPDWWVRPAVPTTPTAQEATSSLMTVRRSRGRPAGVTQIGAGLFEISPAGAVETGAVATGALSNAVLETEVFLAQHKLTARRIDVRKIRDVLVALETAGGRLPLAVIADRAGEPQHRAVGFLTTLQRIFNMDGIEVLALIDDGRTVTLDEALLREQFGVRT